MEDIDKQDLDEQIEHHQEMLRILRRRLRVQERKEAEFGISVPAEVATEIMTLNERIAKHEAELSRLKSVAAEGEVPQAEVEYRAALAAAWDTPQGRPKYAGRAQLELVRLRVGIKPERAEELEWEVRAALVKETLSEPGLSLKVQIDTFLGFKQCIECEHTGNPTSHYYYFYCLPSFLLPKGGNEEIWKLLIRAIRLDWQTAIEVLSVNLPPQSFRFTRVEVRDKAEKIELPPHHKLYHLGTLSDEPSLDVAGAVIIFAQFYQEVLTFQLVEMRVIDEYEPFEFFANALVSHLAANSGAPPPPEDEDEATPELSPTPD